MTIDYVPLRAVKYKPEDSESIENSPPSSGRPIYPTPSPITISPSLRSPPSLPSPLSPPVQSQALFPPPVQSQALFPPPVQSQASSVFQRIQESPIAALPLAGEVIYALQAADSIARGKQTLRDIAGPIFRAAKDMGNAVVSAATQSVQSLSLLRNSISNGISSAQAPSTRKIIIRNMNSGTVRSAIGGNKNGQGGGDEGNSSREMRENNEGAGGSRGEESGRGGGPSDMRARLSRRNEGNNPTREYAQMLNNNNNDNNSKRWDKYSDRIHNVPEVVREPVHNGFADQQTFDMPLSRFATASMHYTFGRITGRVGE